MICSQTSGSGGESVKRPVSVAVLQVSVWWDVFTWRASRGARLLLCVVFIIFITHGWFFSKHTFLFILGSSVWLLQWRVVMFQLEVSQRRCCRFHRPEMRSSFLAADQINYCSGSSCCECIQITHADMDHILIPATNYARLCVCVCVMNVLVIWLESKRSSGCIKQSWTWIKEVKPKDDFLQGRLVLTNSVRLVAMWASCTCADHLFCQGSVYRFIYWIFLHLL